MFNLLRILKEKFNIQILVFTTGVSVGFAAAMFSAHLWRFKRAILNKQSQRSAQSSMATSFLCQGLRLPTLLKDRIRTSSIIPDSNEAFINDTLCIIDCKTPFNPHPDAHDTTKARALANQGVASVFGIENSFTTKSLARRADFTKTSKNLLRQTDYKELLSLGKAALEERITIEKNSTGAKQEGEKVALAALVRDVTFRVSTKVVHPHMDPRAFSTGDVRIITETIDELWQQTKQVPHLYTDLPRFAEATSLRQALKSLFPDADIEDLGKNPMNLIIPSYEAIWRVVMLGFLACQHHVFHADEESNAREELFEPSLHHLQELLQDPLSPNNSNGASEGTESYPSFPNGAMNIAKEALRLYPSSKTIYRELQHEDEGRPTSFYAPISKLHLLKEGVWEDHHIRDREGRVVDVKQFWPNRWNYPQSRLAQKAYVPFAAGSSYCPAKEGFGERIVALLIAVLADGLKGYALTEESLFMRKSDLLYSDREALSEYTLAIPKVREHVEGKRGGSR